MSGEVNRLDKHRYERISVRQKADVSSSLHARIADGSGMFLSLGLVENGGLYGPTCVQNPNGPPFLVRVVPSWDSHDSPETRSALKRYADELLTFYKEQDPERKQPIKFLMGEVGKDESGEPIYEVDEEKSAYYRPLSSDFHPLFLAKSNPVVCHIEYTLHYADGAVDYLCCEWGGFLWRGWGEETDSTGPIHVKNPNGPPYLVNARPSTPLYDGHPLRKRLERRADELLTFYREHDPERKQPILFVMKDVGKDENGEPAYEVDEAASAYYRPRSSYFHPFSKH